MPATGHRCYGWIHSSDKLWWTRLIHYILDRFGEDLKDGGLYAVIRATTYGLTMSVPHFLALLEFYNPDANTFLTKHGELGFALHEMHKISGLPMGNMIYQEYFPSNKELQQLKSRTPNRYNTFWDLAYHYHIALAVSEVNELIKKSNAQSYTTAGIEDGFAVGTMFQTFLWHGVKPIRPMTLLAGYLALWLKKCVVPYQSSDVLSPEVLFPAVLLAHRKNLCLLLAMTAGIYRGLRQVVSGFMQENTPPTQIPLTKVELPYTYLMAWLVLHQSDMMWAPTSVDPSLPFLQIIDNCKWKGRGFADVRKQLQNHKCWVFPTCFLRFSGQYSDSLIDVEKPGTGRTFLDSGCFDWLVNIRPGYVIFHVRNHCYIEPYLPCRFVHQFGYDHIYVENPKQQLRTRGGLVDGARAWLWNITGCTGAKFNLPGVERKLELTFRQCRWLLAANEHVPVQTITESTDKEASRVATRMKNRVTLTGADRSLSPRVYTNVITRPVSDRFEYCSSGVFSTDMIVASAVSASVECGSRDVDAEPYCRDFVLALIEFGCNIATGNFD
ncbi:uncharacterized protein A4U43_C06F15400 [Asparagus officinalis]|uniref:Uncharacterized protein n=1 Tax=Asparagus officinalis TaxID=4686 RepID=A0A5P1EM44_ASPOF|nr:uncharacterized protein A4U43_C06F15400 [Asparagus officinalis]